MLNNVHIIGLGLMGTNLGINLVNSGVNVSGYDTNIDSIERAEKLGAVNISHNVDLTYDAVVLAMPIDQIIEFLSIKNLNLKSKLLIDLGGTKEIICKKMNSFEIPSVGGHPLCGVADNENWKSNPEIYLGAPFLLCETESSSKESMAIAEALVETIGSKFKWIDSNKHDELIGLTSHLPHIISSSLVSLAMKEQNLNELLDLASGGFDGATRLSRTSPNMISSMYLTNSPNVRQLIEKLINELQLVLNMEDEEVMLDYLSGTVDWRRALAEKFGERELS
jgi:prephenate dehydrogenase